MKGHLEQTLIMVMEKNNGGETPLLVNKNLFSEYFLKLWE